MLALETGVKISSFLVVLSHWERSLQSHSPAGGNLVSHTVRFCCFLERLSRAAKVHPGTVGSFRHGGGGGKREKLLWQKCWIKILHSMFVPFSKPVGHFLSHFKVRQGKCPNASS